MKQLKNPMVFIVMGVSGCGKSSVGKALAKTLNCDFYDGDDFHPPENIAKMSAGNPLNDTDRQPWLERLHQLAMEKLAGGETAVIACSSLKKSYRQLLKAGNENIKFIYLKGTFDLIWQRMLERENHYMKAEMLHSQFATLEEPTADEAFTVEISADVETITKQILEEVL